MPWDAGALLGTGTQREWGGRHVQLFSAFYVTYLVQHDALVLGLEPLDGVVLGELVLLADLALAVLTTRNAEARALQHHVEVHTVDTGGGVVLDTQIDVLVDTET